MTETRGPRSSLDASGPARARRTPLTIRVATPDDIDIVVSLRIALLRAHADNAIYGRLRPDVEERAYKLFARQLASPGEVMLLAERDGRVIGCLRCVRSVGSPLLEPAEYAYISSVYVRPEARRGGVLRALMAEAERWCAERGLREMRLHNAADNDVASATWQALGFEVVELLRVRRASRP